MTTTATGRPAEHDLFIVRGDTWVQVFEYESPSGTAVDLSAAAARLQIRPTRTTSQLLLNASSAGGEITLDALGVITVTVAAGVTALLDFDRARWDLELTLAGGTVRTIIEGQVTLIKDVTR